MSEINYKRRQLLVAGGLAVGACLLPGVAFSSPFKGTNPRKISLCNIHTREDLETQYFDGQNYITEELKRINHICRDFRRNEVANMDRRLFDAIAQIQAGLGHKGQVRIISGYRSPETNKSLQSKSRKVAKKSYHMKGQAIDFNLEGISLKRVRDAALELRLGGVGYYPKDGFVHLDTGPVRRW
ncbi:YcbK family protein [uncultured Photobacterium sp.]|uniref:YcbK family protein n=1 Tax=uncultured Photobacterium sp. TaxID=173973 RepID=UPI0026031C9D|nr:YcbK family protein [uncultured Photobacterium sp.]